MGKVTGMKAVILAGGKGTRLGNYTQVLPKPLMPVVDKPILEIIIAQLKSAGIVDIVISTGYLSHLISLYFGDGGNFGVNLEYSREDSPLGTAGPLSLIKGLDSSFIVMNGDVLTNMDINKFIRYHRKTGALATIASFTRDVNIDFGVIELDKGDNRVANYREKPTFSYDVSMGIYLFEPQVLDFIPKEEYLDFPDLVLNLIAEGLYVSTYPFEGYWRDLGRPDDYVVATEDFNNMKDEFLPEED